MHEFMPDVDPLCSGEDKRLDANQSEDSMSNHISYDPASLLGGVVYTALVTFLTLIQIITPGLACGLLSKAIEEWDHPKWQDQVQQNRCCRIMMAASSKG